MSTQLKKFLGKRAVSARYGNRHPRTIERWVRAGVLPQPDQIIRGRWYWDEATLDKHDRRQTVAAAAELERAYDRCRADIERRLTDRFVFDVLEPSDERDAEGAIGVIADHDGAGEDLRSILADFDWEVRRAFRRAWEALRP
jgi:hypothetical protein